MTLNERISKELAPLTDYPKERRKALRDAMWEVDHFGVYQDDEIAEIVQWRVESQLLHIATVQRMHAMPGWDEALKVKGTANKLAILARAQREARSS